MVEHGRLCHCNSGTRNSSFNAFARAKLDDFNDCLDLPLEFTWFQCCWAQTHSMPMSPRNCTWCTYLQISFHWTCIGPHSTGTAALKSQNARQFCCGVSTSLAPSCGSCGKTAQARPLDLPDDSKPDPSWVVRRRQRRAPSMRYDLHWWRWSMASLKHPKIFH